jgi:diacylglycerol kinase (ATP)
LHGGDLGRARIACNYNPRHDNGCNPAFRTYRPFMMESPHKGKTGLRRVWNAFHYSLAGLAAAYRHEDAFRQESLLAAVLVPLALFLPVAGIGKALMVASVLLVIIVELINSAVEATVDRISLENHLLAKRAKDIGSAAVLIALLNVLVVWLLVLVG